MIFSKSLLCGALGLMLLSGSAFATAVIVNFEGVAGAGQTAVGNDYQESGYNFHNPGIATDAAIIPLTANQNKSGSAYYTWDSPPANNPVTLTRIGGGVFSLSQLDIGSKDDTAADFDIIGDLVGGGTVVDHVLNAANFSTLSLSGFSGLTDVRFVYISGDFGAIDNLHLSVPEPGSLALAGLALCGLWLTGRRKSATTQA